MQLEEKASGGSGSLVSPTVKPRLELMVSSLHANDPQPTKPLVKSGDYRVGEHRTGQILRARRVLDNLIEHNILEINIPFRKGTKDIVREIMEI